MKGQFGQDPIAFDIGGIAAGMCLIENGRAGATHDVEAERLPRFKAGPFGNPVAGIICPQAAPSARADAGAVHAL
ncbi:hypothetical protein [Sphingomonas sanxanigenens]|uniref:Uncharacterized protein n=1 Tax=Sphingomonas sanxanigenens DSM 19645 = NX02 TaxID=1123269 RepID=W0ABW9_9SPHN|nr:hypothetical protein [Sphingomonas sanxanigenens]AHE55424.1 hypothetical protein NX02_18775 [Sphingomonas sanxanigenens DSM 19645 = NX02]